MKPIAFDYAKPASIADAVKLLADSSGAAKVIAGGQSLGPMLNLRLARPTLLVDIRHLPALNEVRETPQGFIVGSCVTHAAIEDGALPDFTRGFMRKVAGGIAYRAVRNRGTIGGSVCHADPAADWIAALTLLSAVALIEGPGGSRAVAFDRFVNGPFDTALDGGEILVGVRIARMSSRTRWAYRKFCRKPGDFAEAIGAVLYDEDTGGCRAVVATTSGAPRVIEDARFLVNGGDSRALRQALEETGVAGDDLAAARLCETTLRRAAAQLAVA